MPAGFMPLGSVTPFVGVPSGQGLALEAGGGSPADPGRYPGKGPGGGRGLPSGLGPDRGPGWAQDGTSSRWRSASFLAFRRCRVL